MKLILLEKVYNLGDLGDEVTVRAGYGRNYLLPRGKAVAATPENTERFQARREELQRQADEKLAAAQARASSIEAAGAVEFKVAVSPEGRLYGSIGPHEVAGRLTEMGQAVEKVEVDMPDGALREPGEFTVNLILHADVQIEVPLRIVDEDAVAQ